MTRLSVGDTAPAFSLPNQDGTAMSLSDYAGHQVVLWFFSRAFGSN
jgi:peroxiredoxin Q/BCP